MLSGNPGRRVVGLVQTRVSRTMLELLASDEGKDVGCNVMLQGVLRPVWVTVSNESRNSDQKEVISWRKKRRREDVMKGKCGLIV